MPWPEQDSILANLPKLVQFLFTMVKDVFNGFTRELFKCSSAAELNDFKMFIERGFKELRNVLYQQSVLKVLSA
jgi:hypothetical protein